jgi:hypothetical protein
MQNDATFLKEVAAPDAVPLASSDRLVEAIGADRAGQTQLFGSHDVVEVIGEEQLWSEVSAHTKGSDGIYGERQGGSVDVGKIEDGVDGVGNAHGECSWVVGE